MSSSYEYLSKGKSYDLSRLEKLRHEWDSDTCRMDTKFQIEVLYINLKFLDMFLSMQSFTNECSSMRDVIQKVQALFPDAEAEFKRIDYPWEVEYMFRKLDEQIWETKLKIIANYSFPRASLPLSSKVATPEFVKRFVDTVVMNLSDLSKTYDPYSWSPLVPCSSRQKMEEVVKELKLLRNFVYFISDRCTDPQSQHTFFTHVLVVAGHTAMISWLNLPRYRNQNIVLSSAKMNAAFSDLQMRIQPRQPYIRKIYTDVLQALTSGWHPSIQAVHVADYKAGFVETLVHHMEDLPITDKHKKRVAFKDRITMLNFLRANLINLPREALEDFDTAIISVGLLVYSMYDSVAAFGELNQVTVVDFSGDIQSIQALIYFLTRKSFRSNLPKIDGLGSIDIILDHLKELLDITLQKRRLIKFHQLSHPIWEF